jgi:rSAM/selenodomain-associated transferase 1
MSNLLGIFAKQPIIGQVKTRLGEEIGFANSAELYEALLRDTLARFAEFADRRVIGYAPVNCESMQWFGQFHDQYELWAQPTQSLGERMQAFFQQHSDDDSRVILIGSDSPSVPSAYITQAFGALANHDCVIGPASDGGYYLIGLRLNAVSAKLFENIEWSTAAVFKRTVSKMNRAQLAVVVLPVWYDVDSVDALHLLSGQIAATKFAQSDPEIPTLPQTAAWLNRHRY